MNKWNLAATLNCTEYFNELSRNGNVCAGDTYKNGYFVCVDVRYIHIYRVQVGINADYEEDDRTILVEEERISKWDILDELKEMKFEIPYFENERNSLDKLLQRKVITIQDIVDTVIRIDDYRGYENYDVVEYKRQPLEEVIDDIEAYGVVEYELDTNKSLVGVDF